MAGLTKSEIRKQILAIRNGISEKDKNEASKKLVRRIFDMEQVCDSDTIYCYISYHSEAETRKIIETCWDIGITVAVPKVEKNGLVFYYIESWDDTEPGMKGIPEPINGLEKASQKDAPVIVPGVAFTKDGNRLGYGGGYFDRFFEKEPEHYKIGLAYECQIVNNLPVDRHDIQMNHMIII